MRLVGSRVTLGDAVRCPQLRDAAGRLFSVSYLSPDIALGDRVAVTGTYGVSTRCLGEVLIVETEEKLND